ncbi:hypothetical protein H5410_044596 [Solanum commersonii]|uniref:Uncharacterized protein n=1 Tax=Solanum commersonii TaxID=4109 RepID=A0A9J5X8K0_SOLCO|nr:hypothetical protein H5410_044596 [Solanum commersonii]
MQDSFKETLCASNKTTHNEGSNSKLLIKKDRRPIDGIPLNKQSKSRHGGKFTWDEPRDAVEYELDDDVPVAIDENDPNYVDDEDEEVSGVEGLVVGEIDVAKVGDEGVARVDVVDRCVEIVRTVTWRSSVLVYEPRESPMCHELSISEISTCVV